MAEAPGIVVEHLSEGLLIIDTDSQEIYWNPAALRLYGFNTAEEVLRTLPELPQLFELSTLKGEVLLPDEWPLARILRGESIYDVELRIRRLAPAWTRVFRYCGSRVSYPGRAPLGFLIVNDITQRKQTEDELERVNRLNVALSHVNQAIVRQPDRRGLFQQVCKVLVEQGAFELAWIGWHSAPTRQLIPVAQWGETEYLSEVAVYSDERPGGQGPTGKAFRSGKPYICTDVCDDPATLPWRAELQRRRLRASAAFPIRRGGRVRGTLSVYANQVGFFRDKEVSLLAEAVNDLSFALDHFASEAARRRAQALVSREKLFSDALLESLPGVLYLYDEHGRFLRWNRNLAIVTGYSDEEIVRMHPLDFFDGEDRERVAKEIQVVFARGESSIEAAFVAKNSARPDYFFTGKRIDFGGSRCLIGMGIDITVRKQAEAATQQYARRLQATSHRLLTVQESERRRLARELHDAVGQELTALSLNLTIIDDALSGAMMQKARERLEDSRQLLEETTRHLRNVLVELRPPGLDELGLLAALTEHVNHVARRSELTVGVSGVEPRPRLAPTDEIALFRIAQEALNNVVKHARANTCNVTLAQDQRSVILQIVDDGVGFDTARRPILGGYGMGTTTMRERAEAIGARLELESAPGHGTRISVTLDWPPAADPAPQSQT